MRYAANSHWHHDHVQGPALFVAAGAALVATARTSELVAARIPEYLAAPRHPLDADRAALHDRLDAARDERARTDLAEGLGAQAENAEDAEVKWPHFDRALDELSPPRRATFVQLEHLQVVVARLAAAAAAADQAVELAPPCSGGVPPHRPLSRTATGANCGHFTSTSSAFSITHLEVYHART